MDVLAFNVPLSCTVRDAPANSFPMQGERVYIEVKLRRGVPSTCAHGRYGSKSRISRLFAKMIMPRPLAAISRRKTLPLSVITPSIWPRGARLIGRYVVRARLLNERARAFMRSATASPWGWYGEAALLSIHLLSRFLSLWSFRPHENAVTPYSGWCEIPRRHWFTWVERFIVYAPIKHSIWLHPAYTSWTHFYPHASFSFLSLSPFRLIYINKIKFPCVCPFSLTASRENDSTNFQQA